MATTLLHVQLLPTKPWGVYGIFWERRAMNRTWRSNFEQIVCTVGKHPPEPLKDFAHLSGKPRKVPKVNKKKNKKTGLPVLITVNRSDSKWSDAWNTEQATTLKDLDLEAISTDSSFQGPGKIPKDIVHVELAVQKMENSPFSDSRTAMGVIGGKDRVGGDFSFKHKCAQQCNNNATVVLKNIPLRVRWDERIEDVILEKLNGSFQAWLTPTQDMFMHPQGKSEENGDPTVVYFPLGEEVADLTGMVRDTIRLSYTPKAICSEECDKLGPRTWEVGSGLDQRVVDSRWLPLLKAKQNL